jgi:RNA-directed DNA polymerase
LNNWKQEELMNTAKPFCISRHIVWEAYKKVKANGGAAGVDEESIEEFEKDLKDNLYKLWNRMSSGSYFPPPVKTVEIPKSDGKKRKLGIPTVSDRIAQMVVKLYLEPEIDPHFHLDSYGYRPGKSAIDAVGVTRQRCWRYDYVIDMDIKGFFDNLDHDLVMRALKRHTDCKWILLYTERWLKAPAQDGEGTLIRRDRGTPQGGVISPLLANLFLHYTFDEWMRRNYPNNPFARYADDQVVHCKTEAEAKELKEAIAKRLTQCKLALHPEKTKIVYCKDDDRRRRYPNEKFDFLGYTFRARRSKNRHGKYFINFSPAVSNKAKKKMTSTMRSWRMHLRSDKTIVDLSRMFNPIIRGWINYYGKYYKSELYHTFKIANRTLERWAERKYKKLRRHSRRATHWLGKIAKREPQLFAHWKLGVVPAAGQ